MANLIRSLIENDKKELKRLDSIAKKVEAYADQMAALLERPDRRFLRQLPARGAVLRSGDARHGGHAREQPAHGERRRVRRPASLPFRGGRH